MIVTATDPSADLPATAELSVCTYVEDPTDAIAVAVDMTTLGENFHLTTRVVTLQSDGGHPDVKFTGRYADLVRMITEEFSSVGFESIVLD